MDAISYKEIPLAHQLACEILELKSVKELDYYELNHVIALSLAVNEVFVRARVHADGYWIRICDFFRSEDLYDCVYTHVYENSPDDEDDEDEDYFCFLYTADVADIAMFTMKIAEKQLSIDEGYFNTDLTKQIADIVYEWRELKQKKLADKIADLAIEIVSDENTIWKGDALLSYQSRYEDEKFFEELGDIDDEICEGIEAPFLSFLALSFPERKDKYKVLIVHFKIFKEAYISLLLGDVVAYRGNLRSLVCDAMRTKLFREPFYRGSKPRQDYFDMVSYNLGNFLMGMDYEEAGYGDCLVHSFLITAVKGNPLVLRANDFMPQHVILFSKLLKDILLEHRQEFERGYKAIMYREEHKR